LSYQERFEMDKTQKNWRITVGIAVAIALTLLTWAYWPTILSLVEQWTSNPLYSHGFFVPVFAAALLWIRRDQLPALPLHPSWWALGFLTVGIGMRLVATYYYLTYPDGCSLLFLLTAVALGIGGWAALRWTWPSILFLHFMLPFPGIVESSLLRPLRRVATICSTNALQTCGIFAQAEGNVIVLSEAEMGIVDACSGLKMLSIFVALTVGACFVLHRPIWQKVVIALSSIPIAVLCNVARITVTGMLHELANHESARSFHDDWSAFLMMPMALLLLLAEIKLLDFVFVIDQGPSNVSPLVGSAPNLAQGASHA
jgi:exosortase